MVSDPLTQDGCSPAVNGTIPAIAHAAGRPRQKISLIIPARNRAGYIRAAIGSVLHQTRGDFELIVVDDGSTDDTFEVACRAAAGDPRVHVVRTEQQGVCAALNTGAGAATGDYLGWVDSDDALAPEALERTAGVLDRRPDVGMVYTQHLVMDASGTVLGLGQRNEIPYSQERLLVDFMTFHFRLMRRELFERLGRVDESLPYAEDYDLCLRLSEATTIAHVPEPLYLYRVHDDALSKTHRAQQAAASRTAVERALVRRGLDDQWEVRAEAQGHLALVPKKPGEPSALSANASGVGPPGLDFQFLEAPRADARFEAGLVSCLCVTRGGHRHLQRAIRCFQEQTYLDRELIVVFQELDEGARRLLARRMPRVELVHVPKVAAHTLGALRNVSLRAAHGEFVCGWDDDDWYSPQRIALQLRALLHAKADACLLSRCLLLDEPSGTARLSARRLWEGSLLCRRDLAALQSGYPPLARGEDSVLVQKLRESHQLAALERPELYVYTHHGENTWDATHFQELLAPASELPAADARRILEAMAATSARECATRPELRSSVEAATWPPDVKGMAVELLAFERQLEESQWWLPEQLRTHQFRELRALVAHASREVPFYAERLREAGVTTEEELTEASWAQLPVLTRRDVQTLGERLNAAEVPKSHGEISLATTGGSSGVPVRVQKTSLNNLIWFALHLREEAWHREDPRGTLARLRRVPPQLSEAQAALVRSPEGLTLPDWGPPAHLLWETGPMAIMDDRVSIPDQAAFLRRLQPDYLFTFPANLRLLLAHFRSEGTPLRSLRSVWTMSEVVDDSMRELCHDVFGCRIVHNYSSAEAGYMALQCPASSSFHVQSEFVLLEVLDSENRPCQPGEIGRVVITPLHQFATPLLRYDTGDEAEVGEPCGCGRGLPVLRRIVGRTYDYLVLPGGQRRRVDTGYYRLCTIPAIREFQVVQRALDRLELLLVLNRPLTREELAEIDGVLRYEFGDDFRFELSECAAIARTESGKLRTFVSEVADEP